MDVRMESEHKAGHVKGSINVPLFMLRLKAESLERDKQYICYCETGRRSQIEIVADQVSFGKEPDIAPFVVAEGSNDDAEDPDGGG